MVQSTLPPPLDLQGKNPRAHWNAIALAFLGDSLWEVLSCCANCMPLQPKLPHPLCMQLYARRRHFSPPRRLSEYALSVTEDVRAESQVRGRHSWLATLLRGTAVLTAGA